MAKRGDKKVFDLDDLVRRLRYAGADALSSKDFASWRAFRESERLKDPALLPRLAELCASDDKKVRGQAYFVVGCLGACTSQQGAVGLLLRRCAAEKDSSALLSVLVALEKQPRISFVPILAELAGHEDHFVRLAALSVLGKCPEPQAEHALLAVLQRAKERSDLFRASAVLADRATALSLPVARSFLTHRESLLRANALRIMARSGDASLLPMFLKALKEDRSSYVKPAALESICRVGNDSVVPVVLTRLKSVLARKREYVQVGRTEVNDAIEFLDRFRAQDPRIEKLFETIRTKRADRLFEKEKEGLRKNVPFFANL